LLGEAEAAGEAVGAGEVGVVVVMDGKLMQIFVYIRLKIIVLFLGVVDTMVSCFNKNFFLILFDLFRRIWWRLWLVLWLLQLLLAIGYKIRHRVFSSIKFVLSLYRNVMYLMSINILFLF
jgi:hypothetical protein